MALAEKARKLKTLREAMEAREEEHNHEMAELARKARDIEEKFLDEMVENGLDSAKIEGLGLFKAQTTHFAERLLETDEFNEEMSKIGYGALLSTPKPSIHGGRLNSLVKEFIEEEGALPKKFHGVLGVNSVTRITIDGKGPRR